MPKALITGVTGQDGSYLAELLGKEGLNFGMAFEETDGELRVLRPGVPPTAHPSAGASEVS